MKNIEWSFPEKSKIETDKKMQNIILSSPLFFFAERLGL